MAEKGLKKKTIRGVIWSSSSQFYCLAVQFLITLILSRLLSPNDFATIGLLSLFTIISNVLVDSGFAQSLIREDRIDNIDYSSVFIFNLSVAIIIYIILSFSAPFIATYFHIPELEPISRILFIQIIMNSMCIVPRVVLSRDMKYNVLSLVSLVSITISAICGITAAFMDLGVYSLVIQMLSHTAMNLLLTWLASSWRASFCFSFKRIKRFLNFSLYLLSTSLIVTIFNNLYTLVIGRNFPQRDLGFYTQAKKMEEIPSQSITAMVVNVSYTAMAKVKADINKLRIAYQKVLGMNIYIIFPIMMFCLVSANNLIPLLFGEKWQPSVPYFRILCIYGAIFPLFSENGNILKVLGLGRLFTWQEIIRRVLMVLFLIVTINYGIEAMLWGWVTSMFISIFISFILCGKPIGYKLSRQLLDLLPYITITVMSMICPFVVDHFLSLSYIYMVVIQFVLFSGIYLLLSHIFGVQSYYEAIDIVKEYLNSYRVINKKKQIT